jgi:LysR family transcriptional regulator, putative pyruvate carboxylase regulator
VLLTEHTAPADLESMVYARGRTVLIAAADEPVPERPLEVADLAERTLVVRDAGTVNRREIDSLLERASVRPAGLLEASSLEAVKRCVEVGLGVAIVPSIAVERELELGVLREVPMTRPAMEFGFCLAWRKGEEPAPPVRMLLERLRDEPGYMAAPGA